MTLGDLIDLIKKAVKEIPNQVLYPLLFLGPLFLIVMAVAFWRNPIVAIIVAGFSVWWYGIYRLKKWAGYEGKVGRAVHDQALHEAENEQFWKDVGKEATSIAEERERLRKAAKEELGTQDMELGVAGSKEKPYS